MIKLESESLSIHVMDEPTYTFNSSDNIRTYDRETNFGAEDYRHISAHGISIAVDDSTVASHLVASAEGLTSVHDNSVVILPGKCVLAVGGHLVAFKLPSLDIVWSRKVDWAAVFGVHISCDGDFLLSHGELALSRLDFDGNIVWESGGADIFSEGFSVHESYVSAVDFEGRKYRFDLGSGKPIND